VHLEVAPDPGGQPQLEHIQDARVLQLVAEHDPEAVVRSRVIVASERRCQ